MAYSTSDEMSASWVLASRATPPSSLGTRSRVEVTCLDGPPDVLDDALHTSPALRIVGHRQSVDRGLLGLGDHGKLQPYFGQSSTLRRRPRTIESAWLKTG